LETNLLKDITSFSEWGGQAWASLLEHALSKFGALQGKRVLELGFRSGKMTCLFALLGAEVTGIETDAAAVPAASAEVARLGVGAKVSLVHYDGDLAHCMALENRQFDLVFSKSVLVLLREALPQQLKCMEGLLAPGGRFIFLENAHGGMFIALIRWLRYLWNRQLQPSGIDYFKRSHLRLISTIFEIQEVKVSYWPPIYLIMGSKKNPH